MAELHTWRILRIDDVVDTVTAEHAEPRELDDGAHLLVFTIGDRIVGSYRDYRICEMVDDPYGNPSHIDKILARQRKG